jgi:predicted ATPase/DNA-binding SARP family transcriptional activator/class 3 adenylate cyclase
VLDAAWEGMTVRVLRAPMDGAPPPRFTLALLGGFRLTGPDGVVDLPSKKLAGLLAYLACTAPQPQPRDRLMTLFWGSHFDAQAKQNLRQALTRLRKVLGPDALESDGEVVGLNTAAVRCDVSRFEALLREDSREALSAAADLYRGRLIDDIAVSEEGWNEWLTAERERLLELALGAMMRVGEQELAAGRAEQALKAGRRAIALNNMREDAHRLLLKALAATGRKAEALKHYQDLVALLKRELNTEPDAATKSLVGQLGSMQPSGSINEAKSPPPQPDRPTTAPSPIPIVGRARGHEASAENRAAPGALSSEASVRRVDPERRLLTILVCDLVGSGPLSAQLDPEDMLDLLAAFRKGVATAVAPFEGFVAQYLSERAHLYFGYPTAHEHDAERALRAGFAILGMVKTLKVAGGMPLQARVGIATGLVVIGEQSGSADARQPVAIGETPDLAAQLQAMAAPGEIVIAASTRRLVGRMFEYRALDAGEGLLPSEAWQVRGEAAGISRFDARRADRLSPLVGRQEEMELLLRRWDQAKSGEGRVVLLSGEPGIGKSRIAETLQVRLAGESHALLRYFCSPHHMHSALHPFIVQLERAASFEPGSTAAAKLDRLEVLLKPAAKNASRDVALIAELLAVPADQRYLALAVSPQQKREMILAALLDQLDGVAAQSPVLIVFEDAHWIDPTSLDLLDRTVARVTDLPVLLVITSRPELQPTWVGDPHVTMLPLSRLGRRDSAAIIAGVTGDKALPDAVVEQVLAHTDGVPLFVEELANTLMESGLLRETPDRYVLDGPLPPLAIPTSLQASLVARLDRLGPVKDVAQIAAAIGREFSHELLSAVAASAAEDLDAALERLTASGLISRRGSPPVATYAFKHALVQDAAYATMLRSRRRQLHARIAEVLIERFPALAESQPEFVAHHFTEAGLAGEAIGYWLKAGRLATARSASREAVGSFERALKLVEAQPETRERLEQAIDLRFDLRSALFQLGEFERITGYLREAEALARTLGDQRRLGQLSVYLCHARFMAGHPREALEFGQNAQAIAESLGDVALQVTANHALGVACLSTGDYRQAEEVLRKVLGLLDGDRRRELFGQTIFPAVATLGNLTLLCADQGRFKEAIADGQEGLRLAEELDHPYSLAYVLWALARPYIIRGDFGEAIGLLERGMALSREWNLTFLSMLNTGSLGYAYALAGRIAEGVSLLERALGAKEATQAGALQPLLLIYLGEAYILADRLDDAVAFAGRAQILAHERGQHGYEAQALRLLGEVSARRDPVEQAERHYRAALALAEQFGFRPLVAYCHLGLGTLFRHARKRKQAQQYLTSATTMYREMGMTYWPEQAEAEMRQL